MSSALASLPNEKSISIAFALRACEAVRAQGALVPPWLGLPAVAMGVPGQKFALPLLSFFALVDFFFNA